MRNKPAVFAGFYERIFWGRDMRNRRIHKSQRVCFRETVGRHIGEVAVVQRVSRGTAEIQLASGIVESVPVEMLIHDNPKKRPLRGQMQLF